MKKNNKTKHKLKKKWIVLFVLLIIMFLAAGITFIIKGYKKDEVEEKPVEVVNNIDKFGYNLDDRDTDLFKLEFNGLKNNLNGDEINYDEYAKSIVKLFVIDMYTINNKINKYDIPCLEYILPDAIENYKLNITDSLYKYVEDSKNGTRTQVLPEVSNVIVDEIIANENGYTISASWEYKEDLGYDNTGTFELIKDEAKLYITSFSGKKI